LRRFSPTVHKSEVFGGLNGEGPDPEKPPPAAIIAILTLTPNNAIIPDSNRTLLFGDVY
jgi:hypothetical protein